MNKGTARRRMLPLLALLAAACGSTVSAQPGTLAGGAVPNSTTTSTSGLSAVGSTDLGSGTHAAGPGAVTAASDAVVGNASTRSDRGEAATAVSGPAGSQSTQVKVPGVENGYVKVGIVRVSNQGAAYAAIGASGLAGSGYNERMIDALVKEINKTGIHGLKVKLVRYDVDLNDPSKTSEVQQQEACASYTQDDRVFAAMTGEGEVLDACLKRAGVVEICGGCAISTYDDRKMADVPLLYSPSAVTVNRQIDFYVRGLQEAGFFTGPAGPAKVGFLTYDDPVRQRQYPRLVAELKRRTGLTFAEHGFLPQPGGGDGDARFLSALQNYMLQFKAAGVNRVMMLDNAGQAAGYGMQTADKNGYYPRWGFNSTSGPGILFNQGLIPDSELPGMTVAGWMPSVDIGLTQKGTQWPPGLASCVELFKRAGMTMASDTDYGLAGTYCDEFLFFRDALLAASGVSVAQFQAGAAALGAAFRTAVVYGANQTASRRDGGNTYRVAAYRQDCKCFAYDGPARTI